MATGNFYVKNANNVYAFAMEAENCFDYDDSIDRIKEAGVSRYGFEETSGNDGDRDFCGFYILNKDFGCRDFYNSDLSVNINIIILARSGYYSGYNLDFELEVSNNYYYEPYKLGDYESEEDLIDAMADEFVEDCDVYNKGLRKCFEKRYKALLEDFIDEAIEYANNVLKNLCEEEYRLVGVFSNGEALYQKVNK